MSESDRVLVWLAGGGHHPGLPQGYFIGSPGSMPAWRYPDGHLELADPALVLQSADTSPDEPAVAEVAEVAEAPEPEQPVAAEPVEAEQEPQPAAPEAHAAQPEQPADEPAADAAGSDDKE